MILPSIQNPSYEKTVLLRFILLYYSFNNKWLIAMNRFVSWESCAMVETALAMKARGETGQKSSLRTFMNFNREISFEIFAQQQRTECCWWDLEDLFFYSPSCITLYCSQHSKEVNA